MNVVDYYVDAFRNYAEFDGRTSRAGYWYFVLFSIIVSIVLGWVSDALSGLYSLVVIIPSLAIGARRLHDIGKSGWMLLVSLIPLVGVIWVIILLATKGNDADNQYGTVPKDLAKNKSGSSVPTEAQVISETPNQDSK